MTALDLPALPAERRHDPEPAAAGIEAPDRIGPYDIFESLGAGGMATVFRGRHLRTGAQVALKTVLSDRNSHVLSLLREMRSLPRLNHPGVVRLIDSGWWRERRPWYAMELLEGQPLSALKSRWWPGQTSRTGSTMSNAPGDPITPGRDSARTPAPRPASLPGAARGHLDQVLDVAYRLCDPLAYIHGEGIVHRDLKPSNIFVRSSGSPVLLDFGVVGLFDGAIGRRRLEVERFRAGTRSYMAPEQLRGDPVDSRADLYSFGVLLFELITGRVPFEGDTETVVGLQMSAEPPRASELVAGVPGSIDGLIARLMSRQPRDRHGHVDDVAEALAPFVCERLPEACPGSERPRRSVYLYRAEMAGREDALEDVRSHLQKAANGEGTLIVVAGESGVGKTHFASQVARGAGAYQLAVMVGECASLGEAGEGTLDLKDAPLHPLRGFLRALAERVRTRKDAPAIERLLGAEGALLAAYEPALAEVVAALAPGSGGSIRADPSLPDSRQALFLALSQALVAMSQLEPLLLVLDDLQWADELTLDFLSWLPTDLIAQSPLVILGTYRSEEANERLAALASKPRCLQVTLNRLDAPAIRQMAGDMLAMGQPPETLTRFLVDHSEGNPFFAAEYLRMAVGQGRFVRQDGRWAMAADNGQPVSLSDLPLPRSLSELLSQRLDRLDPDARCVGESAAVLGRQFDETWLTSLLPEMEEPRRVQGLHQLQRLQILEETAGGHYRFRHDKLREALYARIEVAGRRQLHRQAAQAMLALQPLADLQPRYAQLAHHFQQAGMHEQALAYLEHAAELALQQFAHRDAIRLFNDLVKLEGEKPSNGSGSTLRLVRWHRRLAEAHHGLGELESTTRIGEQGLRLAGYPLPRAAGGWVACLLRNVPIQLLHRSFGGRGEGRSGTEGELMMEAALIIQRLAQRYYFLDALAMITASLWSVNLAERARKTERVAMPYALLGTATGICRLRRVSARYFSLARSAARSAGDLPGLILSYYTEATVASGQCRWVEARALLNQALEQAEESGNQSDAQIARTVLANADYFTGRFHESRQGFQRVLETARTLENRQHIAWGLYGAARAMVPLGQLSEARALLDEAWTVLLPQPELPSKIICQGLLSGVHRRLGNPEAALAHADLALQLIRANKLVAYANVTGYAETIESYLAAGQVARARQALALLRRMRWPMPIVRPTYLRLRAQSKWAQGRLRAARADLEKAAQQAQALGLPHEEATAWLGVASLVPSADPRWSGAMQRARELCHSMQCREIRAPIGDLRVAEEE